MGKPRLQLKRRPRLQQRRKPKLKLKEMPPQLKLKVVMLKLLMPMPNQLKQVLIAKPQTPVTQRPQPKPLPQKLTKTKSLRVPQKTHTVKKLLPSRLSSTPSRNKEDSNSKATPTSLPPKRNTTRRVKTRRTLLELLEKFREMEDSFTTAQCQSNTSFQASSERPLLPKLIQKLLIQKLTIQQLQLKRKKEGAQELPKQNPANAYKEKAASRKAVEK